MTWLLKHMAKRRHQLGIRGRFLLAFGALSALTLLVSMISWQSYNRLGDELNQVVENNVQTLSLMAGLKEQGTRITLLAPLLLAAKDHPQREQRLQALDFSIANMSDLLPEISESTRDRGAPKALADQIALLRSRLAELDTTVLDKFAVQQEKQTENQRLRWVASRFLSEIDSLTDNAQRNLHSLYNQYTTDSWITLNRDGTQNSQTLNADLQRLYRIKADVNLLINLVDRAQHLPDLNSLIASRTHAVEITQRIQQDIQAINDTPGVQALQQTIVNLVFLTKGDNNMFVIRSQERAVLQHGEQQLTELRDELVSLNELIAIQSSKAESAARQSASNAEQIIQKARFWMLLMVIASLLFSVLIVWLYVGRYMVARIIRLDDSMRAIANGNLAQPVPVQGDDEITAMAHSLISFRDQLTTLQEELVQAGKLAALGQLSAGIAHEINQPLSAIGHYAHNGVRLLDAGRLEDTEKNLKQISNLTRRANTIITRLKDLARNQPCKRVVVDLPQVVQTVLAMLEGDEVRKQTQIHLHFPDSPMQVEADPVQLEQVVMNLLTNALDAVSDQAEKVIRIQCGQHRDWLKLCVHDNGPGIDPAVQQQIFEPFFTTKRRNQSLGLGLAISFNIVQNFAGKLTLEDNAAGGATFCIQLPEYRSKQP